MQQFFTENFILTSDQKRQCKKVMRMKKGDQIRVVNQEGLGKIMSFADDEMDALEFVDDINWTHQTKGITLIMSLIRTERLEWLIQKSTELGVDHLVLYASDHGVVRDFGTREERKIERFQEIAKEASEQSYRQFVPKITGIVQKNQLSNYLSTNNYICDIGEHPSLVSCIKDESITMWIGPEGGFSESERQLANKLEMKTVSLGSHVLRAETAGMVAVTLAQIQGDLI